jgi:septal ring factor EnvC (AmiA/AmiB activator)
MRYFLVPLLLGISFSMQAQQPDTAVKKTRITSKQFANLSSEYSRLQNQIKLLETQRLELQKKLQQHDSTLRATGDALKKWEQLADAAGNSQDQLLNASKQMQEAQMSFNMQYLQLQSQVQHENRSYTAVSNIMKTKHETVKNSISNIR